ncbi:polyprenyl synthetase family protein [Streptomyces sp. NK08204]|uniref:polyprenyl synthetase family protein n=1 Tax=Streptomyces sp. NK08204 TaxID=2873260 RepID=UPI001CEDF8CF|nr:polyprenyl synthetase family protein [Streptomyces sp. NK08204]
MTLTDALTENATVTARIDRSLGTFLRQRIAEESDPAAGQVLALLRDFILNGGKRIRPLFCYWGWRGAGGSADDTDVIEVATALELFHAAALIHDDIVDDSDLRRGRPTVHLSLDKWHTEQGWQGESRAFGQHGALLAGDACLVWSEEIFHNSPLVIRGERARRLFARLRTSALYGEFLDLVGEARGGRLSDALKIVRYKTASYTIRYPLQIGGALAGADEALLAAYDTFGLLLGEAFQLRDDVIGLFGAPELTGKEPLDDARKGKPTALITVARKLADPAQHARLDLLYGSERLGLDDLAELRDVVRATGAPTVIERMIGERHAGAVQALRGAGLQPAAQTELESLAAACVHRER